MKKKTNYSVLPVPRRQQIATFDTQVLLKHSWADGNDDDDDDDDIQVHGGFQILSYGLPG